MNINWISFWLINCSECVIICKYFVFCSENPHSEPIIVYWSNTHAGCIIFLRLWVCLADNNKKSMTIIDIIGCNCYNSIHWSRFVVTVDIHWYIIMYTSDLQLIWLPPLHLAEMNQLCASLDPRPLCTGLRLRGIRIGRWSMHVCQLTPMQAVAWSSRSCGWMPQMFLV